MKARCAFLWHAGSGVARPRFTSDLAFRSAAFPVLPIEAASNPFRFEEFTALPATRSRMKTGRSGSVCHIPLPRARYGLIAGKVGVACRTLPRRATPNSRN